MPALPEVICPQIRDHLEQQLLGLRSARALRVSPMVFQGTSSMEKMCLVDAHNCCYSCSCFCLLEVCYSRRGLPFAFNFPPLYCLQSTSPTVAAAELALSRRPVC